jgi:formamidopyrimidine-DNA glycosylase
LPELPEVESVRRALEPVMAGARFDRVIVRRPDLRTPFPPRFAARLTGKRLDVLSRRAKYLLGSLSSGETLLVHLGMTGSFRVERDADGARGSRVAGAELHDHVIFRMSSGSLVFFNDPRRFGLMDLVPPGGLATHPALRGLGPEPLSDEFNAATLARACRGKRTSLKAALLDQRVVAGLGNIYVSEALHRARLSPARIASTIATPGGAPRDAAIRLATAIKAVLEDAIENGAEYAGPNRFRVYDHEGAPCPNPSCTGTIRRRVQGGRSTFYCPKCQR